MARATPTHFSLPPVQYITATHRNVEFQLMGLFSVSSKNVQTLKQNLNCLH